MNDVDIYKNLREQLKKYSLTQLEDEIIRLTFQNAEIYRIVGSIDKIHIESQNILVLMNQRPDKEIHSAASKIFKECREVLKEFAWGEMT